MLSYDSFLSPHPVSPCVTVCRTPKEPCAFVYVSHILRRDGLWPLQSASGWFTQPIQAAIGRVAVAIGELLEATAGWQGWGPLGV